MANLLCSGNEKELAHCQFDGWGKNHCESSEAAGVICYNPDPKNMKLKISDKKLKSKIHHNHEMEVRLIGGRVNTEGRVEV